MHLLLLMALAFQLPAFEVASVKPASPRTGGGNASSSGNTVTLRNTTLLTALARAYEVKFGNQIDGPLWIRTERYDIIAKAPDGSPAGQVPSMLQRLLIERFNLKLHHEQRELPAYILTASGTLQLHADTAGDTEGSFAMEPQRRAIGMPMKWLAQTLSNLPGHYDFPFEMSAEEMADTSGARPSIFTIVEGIGLKLRAQKKPFDVIVVDSGNRVPSEN
jgi:uncharacterized protein (TIGR03435 family)